MKVNALGDVESRRMRTSLTMILLFLLEAPFVSGQNAPAPALNQDNRDRTQSIHLTTRVYGEHKGVWTIEIKYPELVGDRQLNAAIRRNTNEKVQEFKSGMPKAESDSTFEPGAYLKGAFSATQNHDALLSILFTYETFSPGAAHPGGSLTSILYDIRNHRLLALSDLFRPKSNFVQRLSTIAIDSLERNEYADPHAIREGAGPIESNFKVFTITNSELVLHFQTYQVAAGAAGQQEVSIPLHRLADLLRPQYATSE